MNSWLFLAGALVTGTACAAGVEDAEVTVAAETTLPRCNPGPPELVRSEPSSPPNAERTLSTGGRASGSGAVTSDEARATCGATSSSGSSASTASSTSSSASSSG